MNSETSTAEKVLNLTKELIETKKLKKDSSKGFNEEIKRLQAEIVDLLKEDETANTNTKTNNSLVSNK
jgi:polyhydroxyalkanoate synthesis regulator phasin